MFGEKANISKSGKGSKMQNLIDYRVRITLQDGRQLTGLLMAFDKFMNIVLADTEEFRRIKRRTTTKAKTESVEQEEKRTLGLVLLRGEQIVSLSVDAPPVSENIGRLAPIQSGPGVAKPIGRGIPVANVAAMPPALSGPVRGVGGALPAGGFGRGFAPPTGAPPGLPAQNFPPPGIDHAHNSSADMIGFAPPGFRPPQ
jgi:small nuclear ribonucleoprotein B and B'